jgi:hypothetical protein
MPDDKELSLLAAHRIAVMQALRLRRHLSLWLTIAAMLMAALAPTVSQAVRASDPVAWAEVCSSTSSSAKTGQAPVDNAAHLFEHCPYCSLHQPVLGMPPAPTALQLPLTIAEALPSLYLSGPRGQHNWDAARPRGPPAQA